MIVCFDIGGTAIKGAIVRTPDHVVPLPRVPTPRDDFAAFVAALKSVIAQSPVSPACVSMSITGIINPANGQAIVANIPCLHGRPLQQDLEQALGLPVLISNDADCFTLAEAVAGAGRGHRVVFGIILGTGVGGGITIDGQLINKDGGYAGEWGHGPVAATQAGDPPLTLPRFACGCGLEGCLDPICSARGLERLHHHFHDINTTAEDILTLWQDGEPRAVRSLNVYLDLIASPLALLINVIGATIIPVGGGLSNVPALISAIDDQVRQRILLKPPRPIVVPAENKVEPGLVGAAILGARHGR